VVESIAVVVKRLGKTQNWTDIVSSNSIRGASFHMKGIDTLTVSKS